MTSLFAKISLLTFCSVPFLIQTGSTQAPSQLSGSGSAASDASFPKQGSSISNSATYALEPITFSNAVYPSSAREQMVQGQVVASILVSEAGDVEAVQVFKGESLLAQTAEETAKKWKFKQVIRDGAAIPVVARVTFTFAKGSDGSYPENVALDISPATEFPHSVRVSQAVIQRLVLSQPAPIYPPSARKKHVQGIVILQAVITKDGAVTDVRVISGPSALVPAAIEAVQQWRYRPYVFLGRPVEVDTQVQVSFTLG